MIIVPADFPLIETERLNLRCVRENDVDAVYYLRSHKKNMQYIDRPLAQSRTDALSHIQKLLKGIAEKLWVNWAVAEKESDELIGFIGFWNFQQELREVEIGYELHPDFQGKGIMSEAANAVLTYGFEKMNLKTINAHLERENNKSVALLERFSFKYDPSFKDEEEENLIKYYLTKAVYR